MNGLPWNVDEEIKAAFKDVAQELLLKFVHEGFMRWRQPNLRSALLFKRS